MHFSSVATTAVLALSASFPGASAQLHQLAKSAGKLYFGSAVHGPELDDGTLSNYLKNSQEFGQVTPGNEQKWDATEPNRNQFSFSGGDRIARFAQSNGQLMRCHTLVWHSQLPGWVRNGQWTRDSLTAVIQTHIANVAGHFKGQCYAWDVVNEALEENGSYRQSVFSQVLGDSYYAIAFAAAAKADPGAKLYYNDYNLETLSPKQQGAARIVRLVKQAGVRIDGVGMQAHLIVGQSPSKATLVAVMQSYLDAGASEVAFTELDIRHSSLPPSSSALARQGDDFAAVTEACLAVSACVGITTWGFTDAHSWVPGTFPGTGDALIYDSNYKKKPAYYSISSALAAAATAPGTGTGTATPAPTTTLRTTTTQQPPATTTTASACSVALYGQCGGNGYTGCKTCASGSTCKFTNDWYSQCL